MKRIRKFWPTALYLDANGNENKISTSNPCNTFEEAWNQIVDYWKGAYHFNVTHAWIDIYENGDKISSASIIGDKLVKRGAD